jgi:hypothetical protein
MTVSNRLKSTVKCDDPTWLVTPAQVEAQLLAWGAGHPQRCRLVREVSPSGHVVFAVETGVPSVPDVPGGARPEVLIAQPHGHEPAATAAIMELLNGRRLSRRT